MAAESTGKRTRLYKFDVTRATAVAITAHGGWREPYPEFTVPAGVTLYFYSSHAVTAPGDATTPKSIMFGNASKSIFNAPGKYESKYGEVIMGDQKCPDYTLSKYHGDDAERQIAGAKRDHQADRDNLDRISGKAEGELTKRELQFRDTLVKNVAKFQEMDILTIRNRKFHGNTESFRWVVTTLAAAPYHYTVFHCGFCRVFDKSQVISRDGKLTLVPRR